MAKPSIPRCSQCRASLSGARLIIEAQWYCPACAYAYDYPEKEILREKRPRERRQPPQVETLFPLPPQRAR